MDAMPPMWSGSAPKATTTRPPSYPPTQPGLTSRLPQYHRAEVPAQSSLATRLRARRVAPGLTQAELAERAGISERAVSDIERGVRRAVYRDTALRLLAALDLSGEEAAEFEAADRG